jgi:hypothetical protein
MSSAVLMHNAQCIMHNWASAVGRNGRGIAIDVVWGTRNSRCVTCKGVSHTP